MPDKKRCLAGQKEKKRPKESRTSDAEPAAKISKTESTEHEFSHVRFKFLLRSPETVAEGLQTFLDISCEADDDDPDDMDRLLLLDSYLKSSPQCDEVLGLLNPKTPALQIHLVFLWLRHVLQESPRVVPESFADLQQHLVKTLLTRHTHLLVNSLRRGSKTVHLKATLMLLVTVASLGHKFVKMLQIHLDFTHANWQPLLSQRDRKDETDVRACMTGFLMKLLQAEDEELIRSLVEQKALLQDVFLGLKFDQSEYVAANLKTIHKCIVMSKSVGKSAKMYLFNSHVVKEMLYLYQWPGPKQWKRQPTDVEKMEYSAPQREIAELVHLLLLDLLANHKLGICFKDRSLGLTSENKNPAVNKVLQSLVTSFSTPLSHRLVTAILTACPDQLQPFLRSLQPHLAPRPQDTWLTCLQFFLKICESQDWPSALIEDMDSATEEKAAQLARYLFPPDGIISALKDGLKHACATVRHLCLQALEVIASRGQRFHNLSKEKFGDSAPLTLSIEGAVLKTLPNGQVLLNLLQKFSSKENFSSPISRDLYKDTEVPLPHVSQVQHLVAILQVYSLAPEHLTGGPADTLPLLLTLVAQVSAPPSGAGEGEEEEEEVEGVVDPPGAVGTPGTPGNLPALGLLHALSMCDVRKLQLFSKGTSGAAMKQGLVFQLVGLMQSQSNDALYTQAAHSLIATLLAGTGLFEGQEQELSIWLHHLKDGDRAGEEVVTFFVGLLRQFIPNPYPAIDRLLERVEDSSQLADGQYLPYVRLEFSPLVMFALSGDFHKNKKIHRYLCNVLIDILHTLHNPSPFSRLVHSLASNLDPEVTQYLTFHRAEEDAPSKSIEKRALKRVRLKQLKSSWHAGVSAMRKMVAGEVGVGEVVEGLPSNDCFLLVNQSLRYLDEMVSACMKTKGELLNQKLSEVCVETLKRASLRLASASCSPLQKETGNHRTTAAMETSAQMEDAPDSDADNCPSDSEEDDDAETRPVSKKNKERRMNYSDDSDSGLDDEGEEESDGGEKPGETTTTTTADVTLKSTADVLGSEEEENLVAPSRYCAPLRGDLVLHSKSSASHLSVLAASDWFQEVLRCVLGHPLVKQWLFGGEAFGQGGLPTQWIVEQLCDVVQALVEGLKSHDAVAPLSGIDVVERCRRMINEASSDAKSGVPESLQPLFCRCLETLMSVGGPSHGVEGLLALVRLPLASFVDKTSGTSTALAETLFRVADSLELDAKAVKELMSRQDFSASFQGLFGVVSQVGNAQLESLALACVRWVPEVSATCSQEAFLSLLDKLGGGAASCRLQELVDALLEHSAQCRSLCARWLKRRRKEVKLKKLEMAPVMLMYLRLLLPMEDSAEDEGVRVITDTVCQGLDKLPLDGDRINSSFLQVVCHLVNHDAIGLAARQNLQSRIMDLMRSNKAGLLQGHVQLLAAILRQQALHAAGGLDPEAGDLEKQWQDFEEKAGRVLVGCLRHLMSQRDTRDTQEAGAEDCGPLLIHLCRDLLSLTIHEKTKADIIAFWPDLVNSCLKYHFKDVKYLSLLRQLVEKIFVKEEPADKGFVPAETDSDQADMDTKNADNNSSDEEEDNDDDDDDIPTPFSKDTSSKPRSPSKKKAVTVTEQNTHFSAVVAQWTKRLGLTKTSDVARNCSALYINVGEEEEEKTHTKTAAWPNAEAVHSWTGRGSLLSKSFFPWLTTSTSTTTPDTKRSLASPSHGPLLEGLCELCVCHTAFLPVMQGGPLGAARGELVSLLAALVRLEKGCCAALPLNALLAAYGASLSLTDQNLLYLMFACDLHGKQRMKPGLWGQKAVQRLEIKKQLGKSLLYATDLSNVLELIDPDAMATSILHFPLTRPMEFQHAECAVKAERMMSQDGCYDPRFLLQVFFHFMGAEYTMDVRPFLASNCMGFTLAALSSHDTHTRRLALGVLANLHSHVQLIPVWSSKPVLLNFLKVVMNGMTKECQKLPSVVTVFLAKAAEVFMRPSDDMHVAILSFLMLKPGIDVNNVPEFYHFFNSPKNNERQWILQHLQDGLRETSDHRLFQRRYVYKLLLCYANSSLSDPQTRKESLKVLVKASSIATVAKDLVIKHGLLPWLISFIKETLPDAAEASRLVCQLLHNLVYTSDFNSQRLWWLSLTRMARQCLLHLPLMVSVRLLMLNLSHLELGSVEALLDIVQHPHLTPSTPTSLLPLLVFTAWHLGRLGAHPDSTEAAANLALSLGFTLPTGASTKVQKKKGQEKGKGRKGEVEDKDKGVGDDEGKKAQLLLGRQEKVTDLRQRVLKLLRGLNLSNEEESVFPVSREGGGEMSASDVAGKLEACLDW